MPQEFEYDFDDIALPVGNLTAFISGTAILTECDPDEYPGEFYVSEIVGLNPLIRGVERDAHDFISAYLEGSSAVQAWFADALAEGAPVNTSREHSTLNHAQTGVAA